MSHNMQQACRWLVKGPVATSFFANENKPVRYHGGDGGFVHDARKKPYTVRCCFALLRKKTRQYLKKVQKRRESLSR